EIVGDDFGDVEEGGGWAVGCFEDGEFLVVGRGGGFEGFALFGGHRFLFSPPPPYGVAGGVLFGEARVGGEAAGGGGGEGVGAGGGGGGGGVLGGGVGGVGGGEGLGGRGRDGDGLAFGPGGGADAVGVLVGDAEFGGIGVDIAEGGSGDGKREGVIFDGGNNF